MIIVFLLQVHELRAGQADEFSMVNQDLVLYPVIGMYGELVI